MFAVGASLYAQNINGRFSSSLYSFERYDENDVSENQSSDISNA